ncbi:MAG: DUF429 domain-containing protein [Opitutales bacterium]
MRTLGIDLSSQAKETAACLLRWDGGLVEVVEQAEGCDDERLDTLIARADAVGIDAPLGWPEAFVEAVRAWPHARWDTTLRDRLRFRETDREVHARLGLWPLSVSTDRIALPAMRAMALLERHGEQDKSGAPGRFFEVYPAGSLRAWGLPHRGYKGKGEGPAKVRAELLRALGAALPQLAAASANWVSDHVLDALVAALTTRAAAIGRTASPERSQAHVAAREGWVHLPVEAQGALARLL